jgi:hypothetical protein
MNVFRTAIVVTVAAALIGCSAQGLSTVPQTSQPTNSSNAISSAAASVSDAAFVDDADTTADSVDVDSKINAVRNGGFEDGRLKLWRECDPAVRPKISKTRPFAGKYDADIDPRDDHGLIRDSVICQRITVPTDAILRFHHRDVTDVHRKSVSYWDAGLMNERGKIVFRITKRLHNSGWMRTVVRLPKRFDDKEYTLFIRVVGDGRIKHLHDHLYVDSVMVRGSTGPAPTPTPSPTPVVALKPPTITVTNVENVTIGPIIVENLPAGDTVTILGNSCAGNVEPTVSGNTVSLALTRLFTSNPATGCTIDIGAAGQSLPLTVQIPLIEFVGAQLPVGSSLVGNVLNLPNDLLDELLDPVLDISQTGSAGSFTYVSDTCRSGGTLVGDLLAPVMKTVTSLRLRPVSALLRALTGPATCHVVVDDAGGRGNTLIVHIPPQS